MDMRTGETYPSLKEALEAGVPESDIALVEQEPGKPPRVTFPKHQPFKSFKNRVVTGEQHGD
jgi:hypothetical protein